ncbi:hypothetical protein CERSUDRAFT_113084 [Gelatoporia subvermispora B]|uniref:Uncharacterized protein n=1 Tax=Ceriporiopsis subvermispora (strain B) TaxID=914234 RepID=M2RHI7_CERS8|nr:hypothetical protein CERSUDRAFT_113084 [Gelatoporia subvermispora B]
MALSLEIIPFSHSLDMYGEPDCASAYSLSGQVKIRLTQSYMSLFERRRTTRLLLQSLVVTFEGQSELITQETGYSAARLCCVSQELVHGAPFELSNDGAEDSVEPCVWSVVFNLTVPGWLPPSALYGDVEDNAGTRYGLYATARFVNAGESSMPAWVPWCGPFRARERTTKAPRCEVHLNRFLGDADAYTPSSSTRTPMADYSISAEPARVPDSSSIPPEIASGIRVLASVPEFVDIEEGKIPLTLRLRAKGLSAADCRRLRVSEFCVEVEQVEDYRVAPSRLYTARYPLPPPAEQPPRKPLLANHPLRNLYEIGLADCIPPDRVGMRAFSLLPAGTSGRYELAGDGYVFAHDADPARGPTWYMMQTHVPFARVGAGEDTDKDKAGAQVLDDDGRACPRMRETVHGPLCSIAHRLHVALTCTYDLEEGGQGSGEGEDSGPRRAVERLAFSVPITFGRTAPTWGAAPPPSPAPSSSSASSCDSLDTLPSPASPASPGFKPPSPYTLPAYSQLFDAYGERKIDYSVPLPLYTPKADQSESFACSALSLPSPSPPPPSPISSSTSHNLER